jgi:cellulose synthase/poly-beta-1,6-N-acetylglucosamine synthase-like glycosyltransferase
MAFPHPATKDAPETSEHESFPTVSVIIPAYSEAVNILSCFTSIVDTTRRETVSRRVSKAFVPASTVLLAHIRETVPDLL